MDEMFERRLADAQQAGRWQSLQFWRRELTDLFRVAMSPRRRTAKRADDRWGSPRLLQGTGLEIRHAIRRLASTPSFTLAAMLTLALAIAANVSIFALVHRVVLNPLPYPESG